MPLESQTSEQMVERPTASIQTQSLSVAASSGKSLLSDISLSIPRGSFVAVIGLSGCGKSTLIRSLAGLLSPSGGSVVFSGHSIEEIKAQFPLAVGYIPQFGTFHADLTITEILSYAIGLRLPASVPEDVRKSWLDHVIALTGIRNLLGQKFSTLSGGQMRRVALAEELIGDPSFLLLDELTTGLDVFSDGEIMRWLRNLAHEHGKTIVLVTHGIHHLKECDSIVFLHSGKLVYSGTLEALFSALAVDSVEELYKKFSTEKPPVPSVPVDSEPLPPPTALQTDRPPNGWQQLPTLLARQTKIFFRDWAQILIQVALILTFPFLVAIFALNGLPEVRSLVSEPSENIVRSLEQRLYYLKNAVESSSLISGLVMFQVILLTLMGANNGAREIAKERDILRKELFAGLSPPFYITSKFLQIVVLCLIQSLWMAWFVKTVCGFPGSLVTQATILFMTTLAMSTTCLAISAASPSAERASLLSIYLVGFQLPLSGAALALPPWLAEICRPFIAAYWGWSGYLRTLDSTRYFRLVSDSTKTVIADYGSSITVLLLHIAIFFTLAAFSVGRLRRAP